MSGKESDGSKALAQSKDNSVRLDTLSIEQLQTFRKQMEGDLENIKSSLDTLTTALNRYTVSLETIKRLKDGESELMIPLSSSMYVRGKTNTNGKVTIDLGTGFFAKVPNEEGQAILKRKIDYISKNRKAFQENFSKTAAMQESVVAMLQQRIQERTAMVENATKATNKS